MTILPEARFAFRAACAMAAVLAWPAPVLAQSVEITPFGGYRVGGSLATVNAGTVVDDDGGPSVGVIVDVAIGSAMDGLKVEGVFSRERADVRVRTSQFNPPTEIRVEIDQLLVGGVRDLSHGRVRPFLAGLLGLTRYAVPGDTEVRFSIGVGAGARFFATRHIGLRLDARGYMTILNLGGSGVCGGGGCAIAFDVSPAFQGDFTAGLLIAF